MERQPNLPQVVSALEPIGTVAHALNCRQGQGEQNPDDREDDQQLNQREAAALGPAFHCTSSPLQKKLPRLRLHTHI
jgi:hypothetical protein